jgi:saccharopine dehydrogenase-like NADP-dependent oxidoreductase
VTPLSVALLGAGGTIGPAIARDLADSPEAAELLLLDLDEERARSAAAGAGEKAHAAGVDARHGLADRLAGVDLLINAASYRVNLDAMRAAFEAGCHYLDLGGLYWMTERQLEHDAEWRSAGRLALLGMGASPGKTNVMAARAVQDLGEPPERIDVVAAGRDLDHPGGFSVPYALRTLIDELTMPPVVLREGRPSELEPLSPGGTVRIPWPIGDAETVHTLHSEMLTFPDSFGCREGSFRLSLHPELMDRLRRLATASDDEVDRAAREAVPASGRTVAAHLVEAEGPSGRVVQVSAVTQPVVELGFGGGVMSTAAPAAAAARLIARGRITATGVLPPERCVEADDLFPELERRGCVFRVDVSAGALA